MKNFKTIITVIAISLSTIFSTVAIEKNPSDTNKNLRSKIVPMLGTEILLDVKNDCKAEVSFLVNNQNELIVISVDSKVTGFSSYVKSKLNYKKIDIKGIKKGEVYKMPIKINKTV